MTSSETQTNSSPAVAATARTLGPACGALLVAVALLMLVPGMGVSLFDRDEGWYAQVSREMVDGGDWLVPHYLGQVWLAKPPLLYWLVGISFKLLGIGEWQARLVPVLASTATVVLLGMLTARMLGRRVGIFAGLLFITSALPALVGKMLLTDSLMLLCTLAAVLLHWQMAAGGVRTGRAVLYGLAIGLGVLAKGPAVLVFAGAFGLALLVAGWRGWVIKGRYWLWLPVAVAVAGPWYIYAFRQVGPMLQQQFLGYEIASRITGAPHGHGGPPGYYLLLSLAGLLPWTVFVPGALVNALRQKESSPTEDAGRRASRLLLVWLAVPWIVLELIHSKLPHYIVPCYVPLAMLLGRELAAVPARLSWQGLLPPQRGALILWISLMGGLGVVLAAAGAGMWVKYGLHALAKSTAFSGITLTLGFAAVYALLTRARAREGIFIAVAVTAAFGAAIGWGVLPKLEPLRLSREVAETVNRVVQAGDDVYICGYEEPSTFFYINAPARPIDESQLAEKLAAHSQAATRPQTDAGVTPRSFVLVIREDGADPVPALVGAAQVEHVKGFNYVKMERVRLAVGRLQNHGIHGRH